MLLKAVITAFPCVSLPFLAVPLLSQPTVAISGSRATRTHWPRPARCSKRSGGDHCLSLCFSAFPCGSTALTYDRCHQVGRCVLVADAAGSPGGPASRRWCLTELLLAKAAGATLEVALTFGAVGQLASGEPGSRGPPLCKGAATDARASLRSTVSELPCCDSLLEASFLQSNRSDRERHPPHPHTHHALLACRLAVGDTVVLMNPPLNPIAIPMTARNGVS
eukprot:SAG22_NODE_799_length_7128_cov_14.224356_7_plen_222_part_00